MMQVRTGGLPRPLDFGCTNFVGVSDSHCKFNPETGPISMWDGNGMLFNVSSATVQDDTDGIYNSFLSVRGQEIGCLGACNIASAGRWKI